jgi:hypothetical protein
MSDRLGGCVVALTIGLAAGEPGLAVARPTRQAPPEGVSREAPGAVSTALGVPAQQGRALLVPYAGKVPDYAVHVLRGNPRWLYFEFPASEIAADGRRFGVLEDPAMAAWMYTVPAPGRVRLYVRLRSRTPLVAQVLEPQGLIRLAAQGTFAGPSRPAAGREVGQPDGRGPVAPLEPVEPSFPADPVVPPPGGEP